MIGKNKVPMTLNGLIDMFNIVINFKKIFTQTRPARAIAIILVIQNSKFGDQIPTVSPFSRPEFNSPAASLSAWNKINWLKITVNNHIKKTQQY